MTDACKRLEMAAMLIDDEACRETASVLLQRWWSAKSVTVARDGNNDDYYRASTERRPDGLDYFLTESEAIRIVYGR